MTVPQQFGVTQYQSWHPPRDGWVKVNFDANVTDGADRGLGVVIRDHLRKIVVAGVRRVKARWSVEVSEAAAALFGLEIAVRFGFGKVQLEGDAMGVVSAIYNGLEGSSPLHLYYDSIFASSTGFSNFCCSFARRSGNSLAHLVARWDTGLANEKICMKLFPQGL